MADLSDDEYVIFTQRMQIMQCLFGNQSNFDIFGTNLFSAPSRTHIPFYFWLLWDVNPISGLAYAATTVQLNGWMSAAQVERYHWSAKLHVIRWLPSQSLQSRLAFKENEGWPWPHPFNAFRGSINPPRWSISNILFSSKILLKRVYSLLLHTDRVLSHCNIVELLKTRVQSKLWF